MADQFIERRAIVLILSVLLLAAGTPQALARDAAQDAHAAQARHARAGATSDAPAASFGVPPDDDLARALTLPTASGANPPYPANHTFDAAPRQVGTPPANHDFATPGFSTGSPPANHDLQAPAQDVGAPPANADFASGTFSGWTTSGTVTLQSDADHGSYARLDASGASVTTAAFTVDPAAQALVFDAGLLAGATYAELDLYVLSGPTYATRTYLTYLSCTPCAAWSLSAIDASAYRGQSIKLQFQRLGGSVAVDQVRQQVLFPDMTLSGTVGRVTEADGNVYARLASGGRLTTSPFVVTSDTQFVTVKALGATTGSDHYYLYVLAGPAYQTETRVLIRSNAPDQWKHDQFNASAWRGQSIKLRIERQGGAIGVDDLGQPEVVIPGWEASGDARVEPDGPDGAFLSLGGTLTSSAITLAPDVQQLTMQYAGDASLASDAIMYVEVLRGSDFSQVVPLASHVLAAPGQWRTLTVGVAPYAGETVKLRLTNYWGRMWFDTVGLGWVAAPGWTATTTDAVATGADAHGSYVAPSTPTGSLVLRSSEIATGIIDGPSVDQRYYAVSYDIGYSSSNLLQVFWHDTATGQQWTALQDAAGSPTGYQTRYFYLTDALGTDGYFVVKLAGGGKVYAIADNIARQHLNEPFSETVGVGIDTTTGAFGCERQDASTAGILPLTFTRYFAGQADRVGTLGWRWSHTYEARLAIQDNDDIGVIFGSGREEFFDWFTGLSDPPNRYIPLDARVHDTLIKNADGSYTFTTTSNLAYHFSAVGRLDAIADLHGNSVILTYDINDRLTTVTDPDGRTLTFTYTAAGQIETLTAPWTTTQDAVTTYTYDANGDLVQVTDPDGGIETYTYIRHHLTEIQRSQPGQGTASLVTTALSNTFDDTGRITTQTDAAGNPIQLAYSTPAKGATQVTDAALNTATYYFDRFGRTTDKVDPLGHVRSSTYDAVGNFQSVIDEEGQEWSFDYDGNGNRTLEEDPLGNPVSYLYNPLNLPTETTDARNNTTINTYDALGNLLTTEDPLGGVTTYTYDSRGRKTSAENALGQTETWAYNPVSGTLTTWTDRRGNDWTYEYDRAGRLTKETDPLNHSTTYEYDFFGNLTVIRDPLNREYRFTYDWWSNLMTHRDPLNNVTTWGYDAQADVVSKTDADGKVWTYTYDANHNMTSMTDPLNRTTTWGWDDANRLISETDALNHTTSWTYDAAGRLATETDPMSRLTTYGYDDAGRLTSKTLPGGFLWIYTYDPNGNLLTETNARNYTTSYAYDALNRLTSMTDALSGVVAFGYDAVGNPTSLTDARGKSRAFTYDSTDHLLSETDPLNRTTSWTYDAAGRLLMRTDPRNISVTYGYDAADNLTSETYPGGSVTYGYDADDRRTVMTDPTGTTAWTFDARSRITSVAAPQGTVGYAYDDAGQRTGMTLPGYRAVNYGYDAAGNLTALTDWQNRTIGFGYNAADQRTNITRPNGVTTNYGYDAGGRLDSISHANGGTKLQSYDYTLDANGNRTSVTTLSGAESYTLDALDRLTSVTYANGDVVGYTYDAQGNRLTQVVNGLTTNTYTYDDAGQLTTDGVQTYTYDAAGNQLTAGSAAFSWDWQNRLTSATVNGTTVDYVYDGTDVRVGETVSGATTDYVWDRAAGLPLLVDDGTKAYLHTGGILAEIDAVGKPTYHLTDALGSVRGLSDLPGTLAGATDYDVFGMVRAQTGKTSGFGFTGEQRDDDTGLMHLRARQYVPETGRFLSVDAAQPNAKGSQGYNLYAYVSNNPCTATDPSGSCTFAIGLLIGELIALLKSESARYLASDPRSPYAAGRFLGAVWAVTFALLFIALYCFVIATLNNSGAGGPSPEGPESSPGGDDAPTPPSPPTPVPPLKPGPIPTAPPPPTSPAETV